MSRPRGATISPDGIAGVWGPGLALTYAVLLGTYFVVRAGGRWAEQDSAVQADAIRAVAETGALMPAANAYPGGYAYPVISSVLLALTGLSVPNLQQLVYPVVSALVIFPAWALYRELTGSNRAAALATVLLFVQPEFLFVLLRGSHERVLRTFMLIALWLLVRSFRFRHRPGAFAVHVGLFYCAAFGMVATNALFGISFLLAIGSAMVGAWILSMIRPNFLPLAGDTARRLASVSFGLAGLGFLFVYYVYPLAGYGLRILNRIFGDAFLASETSGTVNPYSTVVAGWTSVQVYFLLSVANYLLMLVSVAVWIWWGIRWLRGEDRPSTPSVGMLWLLYGAFAFQGALAIWSDRSGVLVANLQVRTFPSFALLATPLVAAALAGLRLPAWGSVLAGCGVTILAGLAALKMTTEPSLSNKWTFYTPAEMQALLWADLHSRNEEIWVGWDERLRESLRLGEGSSTQNNRWDIGPPESRTRLFLVSEVIEMQSARFVRPVPLAARENRVYDNGSAQIFRLRPRSPYQR